MAADIFESYEVTIVSTLILGIVLYHQTGNTIWIVYPLIIRAIGVISSILGTFTVPMWENFPIKALRASDAEGAMFRSYEVSSLNTIVFAFIFSWFYAQEWQLALLNAVGVGLAVLFNPLTSYFTATRHKPVQEIVESTKTGSATTVLSGLAVGMEASVWSLLAIAAVLGTSFLIYRDQPAIYALYGVAMIGIYALYGVAMIGIGMLSHTGNNVAMDAFGPIADNASGIGEMAGVGEKGRRIMSELDAVGNTTKAITKQIAIASAVIAATTLFFSFVTDIGLVQDRLGVVASNIIQSIRVSTLEGTIGFLIGGALPFFFSAFSLRAVSRGAGLVVNEVRRQFKIEGVLEGTVAPDYGKVVSITTAAAQKELVSLVILSVATPLLVGLVFQIEALGAFLAGVILGGKGSKAHMASVVGDTVGDPLKDTAGPALNPMIKVVNLISLLAAPVIVQAQINGNTTGIAIAVIVLAALMVWSVRQSKRDVQEGLG
jgi:K(+)-stimulated pyrophosphate-energized sodium pump